VLCLRISSNRIVGLKLNGFSLINEFHNTHLVKSVHVYINVVKHVVIIIVDAHCDISDHNISQIVQDRSHGLVVQYWSLFKLTKNPVSLRLRCGSGELYFVLILPCFAIFKNVVHSLEPGKTPSNLASH